MSGGPGARSPHDLASPTRLTIDLGAVVRNWRTLARFAPASECAAVVKADAYGMGAARVSAALGEAGCRTFFVATVAEGAALRGTLHEAIIYVLNGVLEGWERGLIDAGLRPVISTPRQAELWMRTRSGRTSPCALHIDTGMNRLGLSREALAALDLARLRPALLMSHLACADEPGNPKNEPQRAAFVAARDLLPDTPASLVNSAGIFLGVPYQFDMIRPGIALYGGRPSPACSVAIEAVATFEARIVQIRHVSAGEAIGYGAARILDRASRVAVIAAGYADGYLRAAGSSDAREGAKAFIAGRAVPVLGRVSMDLTALDITDLAEDSVREGDWVELVGAHASVDEVAKAAGTIGYEILCGIGRRAERIYVGA